MSASSLLLPGSNKISPAYLPASTPSGIITSPLAINSETDATTLIISVTDNPQGGETLIENNTGDIIISTGTTITLNVDNVATGIQLSGADNQCLIQSQGGALVLQGENTTNGVIVDDGTITLSGNQLSLGPGGTGAPTYTIASATGLQFLLDNNNDISFDTAGDVTCTGLNADTVVFKTSGCEVTYGTTNLELVSGAGTFTTNNKAGRTGTIYDTQFNPIFRGKGQGTLAATGIAQAVISCPGITSTDVILLTPKWNGITPKGMIQIGGVTPANGTFDVISSDDTDFNANFMWAVIIA
jgi:hypothetical protein